MNFPKFLETTDGYVFINKVTVVSENSEKVS